MKQVSANLVTTLTSSTLICADLYTFYFAASTKRWTSGDADIVVGVNTYTKAGLSRGRLTNALGSEIASLDVRMVPAAETVGGYGLITAALMGLWDNIRVTVERSYSTTTYGASADGLVPIFDGTVIEARPGSSVLEITAKSNLALAEIEIPRRRVQAACPYRLGETRCGVTLATFTHARTCASGTTAASIVLSSSSTNAVVGSVLSFTSGTYSGYKRVAQAVAASTTVTLDYPLPGAPAIGDGVDVIRGCDKTVTTCDTVFSNKANFGGMPNVPFKRS